MAGLNDDIEEGLVGLEGDTVDMLESQSSIVDEPTTNPNQPIPEKITLVTQEETEKVAKNKNVTISDLFGDGVIPGELPNFDAEFIIVTQRNDELQDFNTVTNTIKNNRSICQEDARVIDSLSPGFLDDDVRHVSYFTKERTQTQYAATIIETDSRIQAGINEVNNLYKQHLEKLLLAYDEFSDLFDSKFKEHLLVQNVSIKNILDEHWDRLNNSAKTHYLTAMFKLYDFLHTPINDIEIGHVTNDRDLHDAFDNIVNVIKNINLRNYLISFRFVEEGSLVANTKLTFSEECISLNELIKMYLGSSQPRLPNDIYTTLKENQKRIVKLLNDVSSDNVINIDEVKSEIEALQSELQFLFYLSNNLTLLNNSVIKVLDILSTTVD